MTQPEPTTGRRVDRLDGNAAGGTLSEIFGVDVTDATIECRHCARTGALAEAVVEVDPEGLVMMCRGCKHQLLSCVRVTGGWTLRFPGLLGLTVITEERLGGEV